MFVKLRFYYRARDSAQNGGLVEKVTMILQPVRSNVSFKPQQILYQKHAYLRVKKKEPGDQSLNLVKTLHWAQRTVRTAKEPCI